jgi:hypothetical protein
VSLLASSPAHAATDDLIVDFRFPPVALPPSFSLNLDILAMSALSHFAVLSRFVPLETRTAYGALLLAALPCRLLLPLTVRIMFLKLNLRWLRLILMLIVGSRSRLCCLMRASLSTLFRTMTFLVLGV